MTDTTHVITDGDQWRSILELPLAIDDVAKVHFGEDALSLSMVDPANVALMRLEVDANGFEDYYGPEQTVGVPLDTLEKVSRFARKRDPDPITISVEEDSSSILLEIDRDNITRERHVAQISTDSIRKEPDIPDLTLPWRGEVSRIGFYEVIKCLYRSGMEHTKIYAEGDHDSASLVFDSEDDTDRDVFTVSSGAWVGEGQSATGWEESIYSLDYFWDIAQGLKNAKVDHLCLKWGQEYPLTLEFTHSDWLVSGQYMLAPRIQSDSN